LQADVTDIAIGTGAISYDPDLDELVCTDNAERHAYARATIRQKRGLLDGTLQEVREALKLSLDESR